MKQQKPERIPVFDETAVADADAKTFERGGKTRSQEMVNASCNECPGMYDESSAEYQAKDRSLGQLCLKCQRGRLVKVYLTEDKDTLTCEDFRIVPWSHAADTVNDAFYWTYSEFNDAEYQRCKAEISRMPVVPRHKRFKTIEELQGAVDRSMAGLQAFYDAHPELGDAKWRILPCTFAITVEEVG